MTRQVTNYKVIIKERSRKGEKDSRRKLHQEHVITNGKNLGEKYISLRNWRLSTKKELRILPNYKGTILKSTPNALVVVH